MTTTTREPNTTSTAPRHEHPAEPPPLSEGRAPPGSATRVVGRTVRTIEQDDGVVLLDIRSGKYFTLNPVGALVWRELARGASREAILDAMAAQWDVPRTQLAADLDELFGHLDTAGLLVSPSEQRDDLEIGLTGEWGFDQHRAGEERRRPQEAVPTDRAPGSIAVVLSLLLLIVSDLLLKLVGFSRFHALVRRFPTRRTKRAGDASDVARLRAAVDRAAGFYFKRAWCLQRSAVTVALLRFFGHPARLVIGVRRVPFLAHAWVELGDRMVNDRAEVYALYRVIEEC